MFYACLLSFLVGIWKSALTTVNGMENGLALTPPMGWMSWQRYRCNTDCALHQNDCLNENLIMDTADAFVRLGLKKAGYTYIIIDDCWAEKNRDDNGELQPDAKRFPHGIKYLADYVHKLGLKLGIYADFGTFTCQHYPGSEFYIKTDAQTFARWDVDYVKMDGCFADPGQMNDGYPEFSKWLNKTGRSMIFSCSWPDYQSDTQRANYTYISEFCNLWRNYDDIQDSWESVRAIIKYYGDKQKELINAAGPGHWNDPDMLIIGNYGLSTTQAQTQMAFWSLLSSPLLISTDLSNLDPISLRIITDSEAIAINQDVWGFQGARIHTAGKIEVWMKPLSHSRFTIQTQHIQTTKTQQTPINPIDSFFSNSLNTNAKNNSNMHASHHHTSSILNTLFNARTNVNRKALFDNMAFLVYNTGDDGSPTPYTFRPKMFGLTQASGYRVKNIFPLNNRQTYLMVDETCINSVSEKSNNILNDNYGEYESEDDYIIIKPDTNVTVFVPPSGVVYLRIEAIKT